MWVAGTVPTSVKSLSQVTRATVANITSKVADAMAPPPPPPSPYHGKVAKALSVPLFVGGIFQGVATVDATVSHVGGVFEFEFEHGGTTHKVSTNEAQVKAALGSATPATVPMKLHGALAGPELIAALKKCDGSKTLAGADEVCAAELSALLCGAGIITSGAIDHSTADGQLQLAGAAAAVRSTVATLTLAAGLTPSAIGDTIKAAMAIHRLPPPPPPPLISATEPWRTELDGFPVPEQCKLLAQLASSESEFRQLLVDSVDITVKSSLQAWAQGSIKAQMGALERLLRKAAKSSDLTGLGSPRSMNCAALRGELINMQMNIEDDETAVSNDRRKAPDEQLANGRSIWSELSGTNNDSVDETARRERQVLRADMEKLATSKDGMASLAELDELREGGDVTLMMKQISELENPSLKRLIHSAGDVSTALAGMRDPRPLDMLVNIRSALERRIERVLYGDKELPAERVTKAIRMIRLGNLSQLKLLHVLDKDDCGTAESPLKQLDKLGSEAGAVLNQALQRVSTIAQLAHPAISAPAMLFFNKLVARMAALRRRGASWDDLGKWLSTSAPRRNRHATVF